MKKINHYVLRNGKLIPKHEADAQQQITPNITLTKPFASIVTSENEEQDQLTLMKKYYDGRISEYQNIIKQLKKNLAEKDQLIHQLQQSHKQNYRDQDDHFEDKSESESTDFFKMSKATKITSAVSIRQPLQPLESNELSIKTEIMKDSQLLQNRTKPLFDSSSLMKRLAHSESLVSNIKKFLKPVRQQGNSKNIASEFTLDEQEYQFLNDIISKHQTILELLDKVVEQKNEQLQKQRFYYQKIIVGLRKNRFTRKNNSHVPLNNENKFNFCSVKKQTSRSQEVIQIKEINNDSKYRTVPRKQISFKISNRL